MYQQLLHFLNLLLSLNRQIIDKSNSTFTLPPDDVGSGKYLLISTVPFLFIEPLKELS